MNKEMTMDKQLFEIPAIAMGLLQEKLDKLNVKAIKTGTGVITLVRVGRRTEPNGDQVVIVAVEGEPVKYKGFTFLARLDHNLDPSGASNIVYTMPGESLTEDQRELGANCEHCGWRRNRKDTFILRKDGSDSFMQVGRTCLKDFFGHDPVEIVRRAQYITKVIDAIKEAEEGGKAYMTNRRTLDLQSFLGYVVSCVEEFGWTSGKEAFGDETKQSTRDQACDAMFRWPYPDPEERPTKAHAETVERVLEYVLTLDPTKSDFNFNMVQMAKLEVIDYKMTGISAAMVFSYNRNLEFEAKKKLSPQQDMTKSQYVGEDKERLTMDVTILTCRAHEGDFGSYYITRMLDATGNLFVSFGAYHAEVGEAVTIRGTVKRHQEYNNTKQTVLNRVMAA